MHQEERRDDSGKLNNNNFPNNADTPLVLENIDPYLDTFSRGKVDLNYSLTRKLGILGSMIRKHIKNINIPANTELDSLKKKFISLLDKITYNKDPNIKLQNQTSLTSFIGRHNVDIPLPKALSILLEKVYEININPEDKAILSEYTSKAKVGHVQSTNIDVLQELVEKNLFEVKNEQQLRDLISEIQNDNRLILSNWDQQNKLVELLNKILTHTSFAQTQWQAFIKTKPEVEEFIKALQAI